MSPYHSLALSIVERTNDYLTFLQFLTSNNGRLCKSAALHLVFCDVGEKFGLIVSSLLISSLIFPPD